MRIKLSVDNSHKLNNTWRGELTELILPHEDLLEEEFVKEFCKSVWGGHNRCLTVEYIDYNRHHHRNGKIADFISNEVTMIEGVPQTYTIFNGDTTPDVYGRLKKIVKDDLKIIENQAEQGIERLKNVKEPWEL